MLSARVRGGGCAVMWIVLVKRDIFFAFGSRGWVIASGFGSGWIGLVGVEEGRHVRFARAEMRPSALRCLACLSLVLSYRGSVGVLLYSRYEMLEP